MHLRPKIVILGGGFAGAYCAQSLEKHLAGRGAEVSLINESNYFIFSPLLIEAGTGSLEPRHAVVPLIGDCASNPDQEGEPYPATAQHAVQLGSCLGENLSRLIHGKAPRPCRISSKGSLAALGCRTGVAQLFGIKLAGFPAWFLWRSFYLAKMPTLSRRIRVALDWTLDFFFSREFVQTGIHRRSDLDRNKPAE